jgi:hypothetical protein
LNAETRYAAVQTACESGFGANLHS